MTKVFKIMQSYSEIHYVEAVDQDEAESKVRNSESDRVVPGKLMDYNLVEPSREVLLRPDLSEAYALADPDKEEYDPDSDYDV